MLYILRNIINKLARPIGAEMWECSVTLLPPDTLPAVCSYTLLTVLPT